MPNAYTYKVEDGTVTSLKDFALDAARAFGALISLRDTPDAPIPTVFEPDTYHLSALDRARKEVDDLEALTLEQAAAKAQEDFDRVHAAAQEYRERAAIENGRYDAMIAKVERWEPPTPDHVNMKATMLQWLRESKRSSTLYDNLPEAPQDPQTWLDDRLDSARKDVEYHKEKWAKAQETAASRTAWVGALFESLEAFEEDPEEVTA